MNDGPDGEDEIRRIRAGADAALTAGETERARDLYAELAALRPAEFFYFARFVETSLKLGDPEAAELVLKRDAFPGDDDQFFWACQTLLEARRFKAARQFIEREQGRGAVSPGYLATGRARLLASTGMRSLALESVAPFAAAEGAAPVTMQIGYMLERDTGDLDRAMRLSARAALATGREVDCRFAADLMLLLGDDAAACGFLADFRGRHPEAGLLVRGLEEEAARQLDLWTNARATQGEADYADRARLRGALAAADAGADLILWGKRSLVALLRSDAMDAADFESFGSYLPNWENGAIKSFVLFHAARQNPDEPRIQERWLRRLIGDACYGDAASWLAGALAGPSVQDAPSRGPTDDMVCFALLLLRLWQSNSMPDFLSSDTMLQLELATRAALPLAGWGLRAVMFEHIRALGLEPGEWHPAEEVDAPGFRRLLGMTTGRLALDARTRGRPVDKARGARPILAISGQMRGFAAAWPALHRHVVAPMACPVVMTVWDRTSNAMGRHARRLERLLPDDIVAALRPEQRFTDVFEAEFPRTAGLLFGEWEVTVDALHQILGRDGVVPVALETESDSLLMRLLRPRVLNGMIRMYYKFARAERLIRDEEVRSGQSFSHVIWSRPDYEITRITSDALTRCLGFEDVGFSSWTTETSFGDYFMVLPRLAFAAVASVFSRVVVGGDSIILPWRPAREVTLTQEQLLSAFGGPETIYEVLVASGFLPLGRISAIEGRLLGRTAPEAEVRAAFASEFSG